MAIMNDNRDFKKRIKTVLRIYLENWMQKFSVSQADIAVDRFENEVHIRLKRVFKKGIPVLVGRINRFNEIYYYTGIEIRTDPRYVWDDFLDPLHIRPIFKIRSRSDMTFEPYRVFQL